MADVSHEAILKRKRDEDSFEDYSTTSRVKTIVKPGEESDSVVCVSCSQHVQEFSSYDNRNTIYNHGKDDHSSVLSGFYISGLVNNVSDDMDQKDSNFEHPLSCAKPSQDKSCATQNNDGTSASIFTRLETSSSLDSDSDFSKYQATNAHEFLAPEASTEEKKSSRVGKLYQVDELPTPGSYQYETMAPMVDVEQLWDPIAAEATGCIDFLQYSCPPHKQEAAIDILRRNGYQQAGLLEILETLPITDGSDWSLDEHQRFHKLLHECRHNLKIVAQKMGKSVQSCSTFYYGLGQKRQTRRSRTLLQQKNTYHSLVKKSLPSSLKSNSRNRVATAKKAVLTRRSTQKILPAKNNLLAMGKAIKSPELQSVKINISSIRQPITVEQSHRTVSPMQPTQKEEKTDQPPSPSKRQEFLVAKQTKTISRACLRSASQTNEVYSKSNAANQYTLRSTLQTRMVETKSRTTIPRPLRSISKTHHSGEYPLRSTPETNNAGDFPVQVRQYSLRSKPKFHKSDDSKATSDLLTSRPAAQDHTAGLSSDNILPDSSTTNKIIDKNAVRWDLCFSELQKYKSKYGHCLVPKVFPENQRLSSWVFKVRGEYHKMKDAKSTSTPLLTKERLKQLEDVGFSFVARNTKEQAVFESLRRKPKEEASWEKYFEQLCDFQKKHGHTLIPKRYDENSVLSAWVFKQRYNYKLMKEGKPNCLNPDRLRRLGEIGFVWKAKANEKWKQLEKNRKSKVLSKTWNEHLIALSKFKNEKGHALVPKVYPRNQSLAAWVYNQRTQYRRRCEGLSSTLDDVRVKQLEELGFVFRVKPRKDQDDSSDMSHS